MSGNNACWRPLTGPAGASPVGDSRRKESRAAMFLAREIIDLGKHKLGGRSIGFGVPYRFYVGIKTEFFDFIE